MQAKAPLFVDRLAHFLAVRVTPANEQERALAEAVAAAHGGQLEVVKPAKAERGSVPLSRR